MILLIKEDYISAELGDKPKCKIMERNVQKTVKPGSYPMNKL